MASVARATFIHPDGDRETTLNDMRMRVFRQGGDPVLFVWSASAVPDWVAAGAEVVAAHDDGSVEAAFTVGGVTEAPPLAERVEFVDTGAAAVIESVGAARVP